MSVRPCRRRCLHCNELFRPDPRNHSRQRYCREAACRSASKRASQARWNAKPANRDYFRGADNTARNRRWRQAHPGYWKRSPRCRTQQDLSTAQHAEEQSLEASQGDPAQQDPLSSQLPVLVGLVASLTDSTQQESIDRSLRHLHALGHEVLSQAPPARPAPGGHVREARHGAHPPP